MKPRIESYIKELEVTVKELEEASGLLGRYSEVHSAHQDGVLSTYRIVIKDLKKLVEENKS